MIESPNDKSYILWQSENPNGVIRNALLCESYTDCFQLSQAGIRIDVSYESIPEFIKMLKWVKENRPV